MLSILVKVPFNMFLPNIFGTVIYGIMKGTVTFLL